MTLSEYYNAYKQRVRLLKTNSITTVAGQPYTLIDRAGFPVAGALNPGNVTDGIVPTDATTGFPVIAAFQGSNKGYLGKVEIRMPVAGTVMLYDVLFMAGQTTIPTSGTTTVTLGSPPSFVSRVPYKGDGTTRDYGLVELFIQMCVAGGNQAHTSSIDYLDQGGAAGNTGNLSTQSVPVNRWIAHGLASGDYGVSGITGYKVNGVTSATGAVAVIAARRLFSARVNIPGLWVYGPDVTGLPQVFADSAILAVAVMDSTLSSVPDIDMMIAEAA